MIVFIIIIIAFISFIYSIDAVSISKFYLIWLALVERSSKLGKIAHCLSFPYTDITGTLAKMRK